MSRSDVQHVWGGVFTGVCRGFSSSSFCAQRWEGRGRSLPPGLALRGFWRGCGLPPWSEGLVGGCTQKPGKRALKVFSPEDMFPMSLRLCLNVMYQGFPKAEREGSGKRHRCVGQVMRRVQVRGAGQPTHGPRDTKYGNGLGTHPRGPSVGRRRAVRCICRLQCV